MFCQRAAQIIIIVLSYNEQPASRRVMLCFKLVVSSRVKYYLISYVSVICIVTSYDPGSIVGVAPSLSSAVENMGPG